MVVFVVINTIFSVIDVEANAKKIINSVTIVIVIVIIFAIVICDVIAVINVTIVVVGAVEVIANIKVIVVTASFSEQYYFLRNRYEHSYKGRYSKK